MNANTNTDFYPGEISSLFFESGIDDIKPDFKAWPKISRLFRSVVVTEKIDGTNAAVLIDHKYVQHAAKPGDIEHGGIIIDLFPDSYTPHLVWVGAQSRKRLITPETDNHGFAAWVRTNAWRLAPMLGEGRHFGEWWGSGIQRGYGLEKGEKRFSLFNISKYDYVNDHPASAELGIATVPIIDRHDIFDTNMINYSLNKLIVDGSYASPGFDRPEGIVTFHEASNTLFKTLVENDELPKGRIDAE